MATQDEQIPLSVYKGVPFCWINSSFFWVHPWFNRQMLLNPEVFMMPQPIYISYLHIPPWFSRSVSSGTWFPLPFSVVPSLVYVVESWRRKLLSASHWCEFLGVMRPRDRVNAPGESKLGFLNAFDVLVDFANSIFNMELGWNMEELQIQGIRWSFYPGEVILYIDDIMIRSNIAHIHKWNRLIQQDEVS